MYAIRHPAKKTAGLGVASFNGRRPESAAVVEAIADPHEPPMPPKATLEQVRHLVESLARGTPARGKIVLTIASDLVREIV